MKISSNCYNPIYKNRQAQPKRAFLEIQNLAKFCREEGEVKLLDFTYLTFFFSIIFFFVFEAIVLVSIIMNEII